MPMTWRDCEIPNAPNGKPEIHLHGALARWFDECGLVAEPMVAAQLQHLGADETLDQAEHVGVGAALDLAEKAPLAGAQEVEVLDEGQAVGQELVAPVEAALTDHVAVDVPANALGVLDALGIALMGGGGGDDMVFGLHGVCLSIDELGCSHCSKNARSSP